MNRHEDELEKEIADKYIENMDAPDLWGKIEAGLDAVDAHRVQDKKSGDKKFGVKKDRKDRNRRTIQIVSGLVAAAVVPDGKAPAVRGQAIRQRRTTV